MSSLLGLLKFITGFSLAIAILLFSGMYTTRYLVTRLTAPPNRPVFPEESASSLPEPEDDSSGNVENDSTSDAALQPDAQSLNDTPPLEPGAYKARVIQPIGLILRQGPDVSTTQLGGIAYNETVIVLSESNDQRWIQVRLPGSNVEGWVKNGNTEKLN